MIFKRSHQLNLNLNIYLIKLSIALIKGIYRPEIIYINYNLKLNTKHQSTKLNFRLKYRFDTMKAKDVQKKGKKKLDKKVSKLFK